MWHTPVVNTDHPVDPALSDLVAAIVELQRLARRILVYLGDRQLKTDDGIEVWPFDRFTVAVANGSLVSVATSAA